MRITVFGTGYVGLVQGAVLAEVGHDVLCVDVDAAKVEALKAGRIPIFEPGLEEIVKKNHAAGRLLFTTDADEGVAHGRVQFIAVGTPPDEDGSADMQYVMAVATTIAERMQEPKVVVDKSTVPVGTADRVQGARSPRCSPPAAPTSASTWSRTRSSSRRAPRSPTACAPTGSSSAPPTPSPRSCCARSTRPFNRNHDKIIVMDVRSAELTKYAANCMLATKISFMNEMANLAERLGADVEAVRLGIGSDPRIGYHFIYPGAGYGGSCFPKDVKALIHAAREVEFEPKVLAAVEARNDAQKEVIFDKIARHFQGALAGRTFALWGLAFKPNTDDMREAASPRADGGALGSRRQGAGLRPRGDGGDPAHLRRPRRPRARRHQGGGAAGRRRARHHDRVAGLPRARTSTSSARSSPRR